MINEVMYRSLNWRCR